MGRNRTSGGASPSWDVPPNLTERMELLALIALATPRFRLLLMYSWVRHHAGDSLSDPIASVACLSRRAISAIERNA
jgi:hypothetical protein